MNQASSPTFGTFFQSRQTGPGSATKFIQADLVRPGETISHVLHTPNFCLNCQTETFDKFEKNKNRSSRRTHRPKEARALQKLFAEPLSAQGPSCPTITTSATELPDHHHGPERFWSKTSAMGTELPGHLSANGLLKFSNAHAGPREA